MTFRRLLVAVTLVAFLLTVNYGTANAGEVQGQKKGFYLAARIGLGTSQPFPANWAMELQTQYGWSFKYVTVGLTLEYNPFFNFSKPSASEGAFHFAGFIFHRWQVSENVGLRFEVSLGGSVLLFDIYSYSRGDVGLVAGMKLLGLDIKLSNRFTLCVDLLDMIIPVYHIDTLPFIYPQMRWGLGFSFN